MYSQSESIGELITALAKAQSEFTPALKDSDNPFFKSKYADLAANLNAVRPSLNKNGIAVIQADGSDLSRGAAIVRTSLHCGEQWIAVEAEAPALDKSGNINVQTIGSAWTYLRRYTLQAICGLASEDDDGNSLAATKTPAQAGAISHQENAPRATSTRQSAQQAHQGAASPQQAAQPQAAQLKFIPPNGLTAVIKGVKEIEALAAKPANGDIPAMKAVRGRLIVSFLGQHNGVEEASCFDTKFWPVLKESVGLECHFQIAEKDANGKHYINIEDVIYVAGEEYVDGKPVQGEQQ